MVAKVETACGGSADGATVAVWGLTFKANTDDRRDSPSLQIAHRLADLGATVQAFDPTVDADADVPDLDDLQLRDDPYAAAAGAAVLVVLTEWDEFRWLDFSRVGCHEPAHIVDARNLLDPAARAPDGVPVHGIGRR